MPVFKYVRSNSSFFCAQKFNFVHDQVTFPNRSCDIGRQHRPEIARLRGEKRASSVRDLTGISSGNSASAVLCRGVNSEDSGTILSDATSKNCRDTNWHSRLWLETEATAASEASHSMLRVNH